MYNFHFLIRITLSDTSSGIGVSEIFIKDLGLSQSPARSTMSDGNRKTDGESILEYIQNCKIIEFNNCGYFPELEDTNRFVRLVNERFVS